MTSSTEMPFFTRMGTYAVSACFADFVTFPLDVAKVRLQVQGEKMKGTPGEAAVVYRGLPGTIVTIIRNEGFRSLFNGLSAGLQRQMCFASIRFGMYDSVKNFYMNIVYGSSSSPSSPLSSWSLSNNVSPTEVVITPVALYPTKKEDPSHHGLNVPVRIAAGLTTGSMCVLVAQPTDVVKVRFQAFQGTKGVSDQKRYRSTLEAYRLIYKNEGVSGLWKGTFANATRNSIVNCAEIVVYDTVKDFFIQKGYFKDDIYCHFTTASIAGICGTFVASPVDVVKTRYMNSPKGTYSGAFGCAINMYKKEGFLSFYKGFVPSFCRIASWNIILWISFEQLKIIVNDVRKKYN